MASWPPSNTKASGSAWTRRGIAICSRNCGAPAAPPGKYGDATSCRRRVVRVLITGTDGYIGSVLAPALIARGHDIVGLDTEYYREARLGPDPDVSYPVLAKDLRHVTPADLEEIGRASCRERV